MVSERGCARGVSQKISQGNSKGFTLIEVVLVLAIGGLIFLLAFLAFRQVQQSRRDTQRRSDAALVISELQNYSSDSHGQMPVDSVSGEGCSTTTTGSFGLFLSNYVCRAGSFDSPQGPYTVADSSAGGLTDAAAVDTIMHTANYDCSGAAPGVSRIHIRLESGVVCRDSR